MGKVCLPLVLKAKGQAGVKETGRRGTPIGRGEEPEGALLFIPKSRWDDPPSPSPVNQVEARSTRGSQLQYVYNLSKVRPILRNTVRAVHTVSLQATPSPHGPGLTQAHFWAGKRIQLDRKWVCCREYDVRGSPQRPHQNREPGAFQGCSCRCCCFCCSAPGLRVLVQYALSSKGPVPWTPGCLDDVVTDL